MCGIIGAISNDVKNSGEFYEFMSNLLQEADSRGRDATGFAAIADGNFITDKLDVPADSFVKLSRDWRKLHGSKSISMIGHTRAATNGTPNNNKNNHPFHGPRFSMIHNGGIWNHEKIADENNFALQTECDSEVILHFLEGEKDEESAIAKAIGELNYAGWFAVSFLNRDTGDINLFREGHSPCVVMRIERWNAIVFASTPEIIFRAMSPIVDGYYVAKEFVEYAFPKQEIPDDAHVKLVLKDLSIYDKDLFQLIDYKKYNSYTTVSSADTAAFSGGQSTWDRDTPHDSSDCVECLQPLEEITGPTHEIGANFMCDKCWHNMTDFKSSENKKTLEQMENEEDASILSSICKILPNELAKIYNDKIELVFDRILHHREALNDSELSENDSVTYLTSRSQSIEFKISNWSDMDFKKMFALDDGEYLAYIETISEALSLVS